MHSEKPPFSWPIDWKPDIHATLMFVIRQGEILLIKKRRGIGAGKINGPGGKFEAGETAQACVLREVKEELAIEVINPQEVGILHFMFIDHSIPDIQCHVFTAQHFLGIPTESPEAIPFWCNLATIPFQQMWEDDRYWFPLMLAGEYFQAYFKFEGERMVDFCLSTDHLLSE